MSKSIRLLVSKNIKSWRIRKGLSQEKLAQVSGHSVRFISRLENQPQNLTIESLATIALALGVTVADLVSESGSGALRTGKKKNDPLDQAIKLLQAYRSMLD